MAVTAKDEEGLCKILAELRAAVIHEYTKQVAERLLASYPLDPT